MVGSMGYGSLYLNSIIVGGDGYGLHGWHNARSIACINCLICDKWWNSVLDGSGHLFAHNLIFSANGQPGREGPIGGWFPVDKYHGMVVANNIFGPGAPVYPGELKFLADHNAFMPGQDFNPNSFGGVPYIVPNEAEFYHQLGTTMDDTNFIIQQINSLTSEIGEEEVYGRVVELNSLCGQLRSLRAGANSPLANNGRQWYQVFTPEEYRSVVPLGLISDEEAIGLVQGARREMYMNGLCEWDASGVELCPPHARPSRRQFLQGVFK